MTGKRRSSRRGGSDDTEEGGDEEEEKEEGSSSKKGKKGKKGGSAGGGGKKKAAQQSHEDSDDEEEDEEEGVSPEQIGAMIEKAGTSVVDIATRYFNNPHSTCKRHRTLLQPVAHTIYNRTYVIRLHTHFPHTNMPCPILRQMAKCWVPNTLLPNRAFAHRPPPSLPLLPTHTHRHCRPQ